MKLEDRIKAAEEGVDAPKLSAGEGFINFIRPAGAALFLILFILVTVILFTAKGVPVDGYAAQHDSSYYREHISELAAEIGENMLPKLDAGEVTVAVSDGVVVISGDKAAVDTARLAIIHYYSEDLFEFTEN